jgi:antitoxin CcdA
MRIHANLRNVTMYPVPYDPNAPKKSANLSINNDLLQQAKALNINLSQTLEQRLAELVREARRQAWLQENQTALDDYNQHIESHGAFSDGLRRF